jgi:hypothetical protein
VADYTNVHGWQCQNETVQIQEQVDQEVIDLIRVDRAREAEDSITYEQKFSTSSTQGRPGD